jgi:predicted RNase H-like HicB family nuclease
MFELTNGITVAIMLTVDNDGYTAYFERNPSISAGGSTIAETLRELANAWELAKELENSAK